MVAELPVVGALAGTIGLEGIVVRLGDVVRPIVVSA